MKAKPKKQGSMKLGRFVVRYYPASSESETVARFDTEDAAMDFADRMLTLGVTIDFSELDDNDRELSGWGASGDWLDPDQEP